jgi:serine/threonine protein kinase
VTLAPGSKLGPYEILAPIGAGGMGEVYRAKDPRLGRDVAIKVLPATFSADTDRLRRFEQEARAAGVLNHPNITAVYDIGSHDDAPYVVQELLEGETLRAELAGGRFSPRKAIDHALQIAHGLAAAHEKGIVHRDLKPENLFVTNDGRVKILDFGLAKLTQVGEGSGPQTNLPTATAGTEPGVVMGTLGYMSPEQIKGKPADARSDIFAFGAILYEMLSGKRAFHADSAGETMAAILKEDPPDLSVTNQNVSPGLERVVRHCLEKNPERRFHSAHDLAFDLEALSGTSGQSAVGSAKASGGRRWPWLALAGAAAIVAAFAAGRHLWKESAPSQPTFERITFRRGNLGAARFAPDGKSVVYGASWEGQPIEIYTVRPGSPESTPLGYKNASLFDVSSSGELALSLRASFLSGSSGIGTLARAPLGGGVPREVMEFVEWATWSRDGKDLAIVRFVDGENRLEYPVGKVLARSPRGFYSPRFSPRGDRIAFLESGGTLYVTDLSGKSTTLVERMLRGISLAWAPSGREIWVDARSDTGEGRIVAVDLAGKTRVLARAPGRLIPYDVAPDGRALVEHASSRRRLVGLAPGESRERDLSWFDGSVPVGLSADARTLLLQETGDASGATESFYLKRTDGSPAVRLGDGDAFDLSPDGKWVLVRQDGNRELALVPAGTGDAVKLPAVGVERIANGAFLDDGRRILFFGEEKVKGTAGAFYLQEIPAGKPQRVATGYGFTGRPVSPDGTWIIGFGPDWKSDLQLIPLGGGEPRTIPNTNTVDPIRWSLDGKSILAFEIGSLPLRIVRVDVATGRREPWKEVGPADLSGIIAIDTILIAPDEKSYVYGYSSSVNSDLYIVSGLK